MKINVLSNTMRIERKRKLGYGTFCECENSRM
jgi:hypothetical protein